ncbi:hypothetical protein ACJX0J_007897, partial [Zea mays]
SGGGLGGALPFQITIFFFIFFELGSIIHHRKTPSEGTNDFLHEGNNFLITFSAFPHQWSLGSEDAQLFHVNILQDNLSPHNCVCLARKVATFTCAIVQL